VVVATAAAANNNSRYGESYADALDVRYRTWAAALRHAVLLPKVPRCYLRNKHIRIARLLHAPPPPLGNAKLHPEPRRPTICLNS